MDKFSDETTCRICFKKQHTVYSLFRKRSGISPCEKLNKIGLKADVNDAGPACICCDCLSELEITVNFLEKCEKSNQILAEHFSRGLEFTEEIKNNLDFGVENHALYTENRVVEDKQDVNVECNSGEEMKASESLGLEEACCEECGSRRRCRHWSPPTTHTCPYCMKVFNRKFNFKLHLKRHSGEREWSCARCGACAVSAWLAARHCAPRRRRACPLPGCGKTYTTITNLNTHLRVHSGCVKRFASRLTLQRHARAHAHNNAGAAGGAVSARAATPQHACVLCPARYHHKQSLNKHVRKQHMQNELPVQVATTEITNEIECDL